jgi:hypothetical protein
METEFQHLSTNDIASLVERLREIRQEMNEFSKFARQDELGFIRFAPPDFYWADFYSDPLALTVKKMKYLLDEEGQLESVSRQSFLLDSLNSVELKIRDMGKGVEHSMYVFLCLQIALGKSLEALELYGKSINSMVYETLNGNAPALFDAIKIDHSVISNKQIAQHIAIAELKDDKIFMKKLSRALLARPKKKTHGLKEFRFVVACLHEMGHLETMTSEEKYQLLAKDLNLYSASNDDPASMIRLINRMNLTSRT